MRTHLQLPLLTDFQLEIINGSLLGDGSLHRPGKVNQNWKFYKGQSICDYKNNDKKTFLDWHFTSLIPHSSKISKIKTFKKIINLPDGRIKNEVSKTYYERYEFTTHCHPIWTELSKKWYLWNDDMPVLKNNRIIKIIPKDVVLTPTSVCIWFMDDGHLDAENGNATFCTNGFTWRECEFLSLCLERDLGIESHVKNKQGYPVIFVGVKSIKKLINAIKPIVQWECFKYKLDDSYSKKPHKGENHSLSKFTEEQCVKMIDFRRNGMSVKDISQLFETNIANVSNITSGKSWKHLGNPVNVRRKPRISQEQKNEVFRLFDASCSKYKIAKILNIDYTSVTRILKNKEMLCQTSN